MLNSDALSALNQLKQSIEDSKDYGKGIVRGTHNRFGFVNLEDGREAFLNPDEMQKVLPGDTVKVLVTENERKKLDAKLEKLFSSEFKTFVGRYIIKGKNHFVQADHPQATRWFFVPPKERKKYQDGDYVNCQVTRHPFRDGKAQVKIVSLIGKPKDNGIERSVIIEKFQLRNTFEEAIDEDIAVISQLSLDNIASNYRDLRDKSFVTIDAASTKDMDDALYIETTKDSENSGWIVYVAIANPGLYVSKDSRLDKEAFARGSSAYLLGGSLPMFPTQLSHDIFSLVPDEDRPALICQMTVSETGEISEYDFYNAIIKSHHKLSYQQASDTVQNDQNNDSDQTESTQKILDESTKQLLCDLYAFSNSRLSYRQKHAVVQQDNTDYVYLLDKSGHIESVDVKQSTLAHRIVEEAMLATNCSAGEFLAKHAEHCQPLFTTHTGFKTERLHEIEQLVKKDFPDVSYDKITDLDGYIAFIQTLAAKTETEEDSALIPSLRRLLRPAELTTVAGPHFGLGFSHYAMVTSPIRRYQDLTNHRAIQKVIDHLQNETSSDKNSSAIDEKDLQNNISHIRQASRQLDQWLLCEYLQKHLKETFTAKVAAVSNQGLAVRLVENGAESFIRMKNTKEKPAKYDSIRMTLTYDGETYRVDQEFPVTLIHVDRANRQFTLKKN